jgi:leucyl-tRNA synthetase
MATETPVEDRYSVHLVEERWRQAWAADDRNRAVDGVDPKFYCLEMFPYPSGHLHMGHVRVYTIGDVLARYHRMRGLNVLHPMGWDAFGLPAENAAIKAGGHPEAYTRANIAHMKQQMQQLGLSLDWSREVTTCDPDYYRHTQELFLLLYERGLAYRRSAAVNWCPSCATVLANEQVEEGRCWRCESPVIKKDLVQWFFRITAYADRLLHDLDALDWPNFIKVQQQHWIGRSEGATIDFPVPALGDDTRITVFTTRPDTLFGATYVVLAPEHPLTARLTTLSPVAEAIQGFVEEQRSLSEQERTAENVEKRGVPTGLNAVHPLTGQPVPIWVANYVLADYGTGAVMGVPAHDARDFAFARKYGLDIRRVVEHPDEPGGTGPLEEAYVGPGRLVNSGEFNGLPHDEAKRAIAQALASRGLGGPKVTYRMRDWLVSRQRYWGTPIPMVHCPACGTVAVPRSELPVRLPPDVAFTGTGESPLAGHAGFVETTCPQCGGPARRETDTMDTFIDSSWYFLRYTSPDRPDEMFGTEPARFWMPVDLYVGGKEHAILHLLYSRFITKVLYDAGWASVDEPFHRLLVQGMVVHRGAKMSKSRGNVVSPEDIIAQYGADAARLFMLFQAPYDKDLEWSEQGVEGAYRFLQRVFRLVTGGQHGPGGEADERVRRALNRAVKKVTEDIGERYAFNTAVAALMELTNALMAAQAEAGAEVMTEARVALVRLLAPLAPFLAEELWHRLGQPGSVHDSTWPAFDPAWLEEDTVEIAIQVNGKVRARLVVPRELGSQEVERRALGDHRVQEALGGLRVQKVVTVPGRLVNVVAR